jgi:hypothetical protein
MSREYATEKFYRASLSLVGPSDIKKRLESAALAVIAVQPDDIPSEFRELFEEIKRAFTQRDAEVEGEGQIHASIRHMSETEADELAERIFHLYAYLLHGTAL